MSEHLSARLASRPRCSRKVTILSCPTELLARAPEQMGDREAL